ncbi:cyclase family protein [Actinomycetospora straminea]|uniref:Kynurenine formamidase n=1 Tax=Actinomycetospora straminea TaxID=663607 RepID=A0ABP9F7S8_9PSEU|nr:cyclase family protein [Actinomycetospora straminea]MDD7934759.1 cyclase family protein [Actinomycetospora straminea]
MSTAAPEAWWPSRYGADDEAGALNEITAEGVVAAAGLVRRGRVHDLAHVLDEHVPAFPGRSFRQYLTTNYHHINRRGANAGPAGLGANNANWIVEQVTATQQMGTHLDGLNHLQDGDRTYNGHRLAEIVEDHGTSRLGIDTLPQIVTRGLCLDIAAVRGVERLDGGDVVTPDDVRVALDRAGLTVRPGDAVLFHTGWGGLWGVDNATYAHAEPGPGVEVGEWLADARVALTGADTWSFGAYPPEHKDRPFVVPQTLNTRHGVLVAENLRLGELVRDRVAEFLLVVSHAKLRGATGAWVAPLAIT